MIIIPVSKKKTVMNNRLISLDAFRGVTIAAMILVNNQGDWGHVYPVLRHASWHGWLGADIVFPFFLFAVGASIFLALQSHRNSGMSPDKTFPSVLRRTVILIALGMLLNLFPFFNLSQARIPGVLQRIGLCYCFGAVIFLYCTDKLQIIISIALVAVYGALLFWVTPSGLGHGSLEPCCNLPGFIDSIIFPGHTYEHAPAPGFDPEGLLSTIPAITSTMLGVFAARRICSHITESRKMVGLIAGGAVMIAAGLLLDYIIPINKNLWTPSYVLFMGGMAVVVLSLLYYLCDIKKNSIITSPFLVLGRNAIAVYILSSIAGKAMISIMVPFGNAEVPVKTFIYTMLFASWLDPFVASLLYAVLFLILWFLIMYILYRRRIFINV